MKKLLSATCLGFTLFAGCSLFTPVKTPLQSTPGNHVKAQMTATNGYAFDWLDQQNSSYSNLNLTVNSNGMSSFSASGVVHTMDPGVISMSGASYLASQQAQYAAQQQVLTQILAFATSIEGTAALAARSPVLKTTESDEAFAQIAVEERMLSIITNQQAAMLEMKLNNWVPAPPTAVTVTNH